MSFPTDMDLLQQFHNFISEKQLIQSNQKVLLAVSGGIDSVVMCHLFSRTQFPFAIAHCNFGLRDSESGRDETFVKSLAGKLNVPFFVHRVNTLRQSKDRKLTIQETARVIRYDWFRQVCDSAGYDRTATAHHLSDSVETFFINLMRGTGIDGLAGIGPLQPELNVIRPLLFATRDQLEAYQRKEGLEYCHDASNDTDDYFRNKIRHHLLPAVKTINPGYEKTMETNLQNLSFAKRIVRQVIQSGVSSIRVNGKGLEEFSLEQVSQSAFPVELLYEALRKYGFNRSQVHRMIYGSGTGKVFLGNRFKAFVDRSRLVVMPDASGKVETKQVIQKKDPQFTGSGFSLALSRSTAKQKMTFKKQKSIHYVDEGQLDYPLKVRSWKKGDYFYPLGMNRRKKVSDFLVDEKVPMFEKENIFVILSGNEIVCILGQRTDNRFRLTDQTKKILTITYTED